MPESWEPFGWTRRHAEEGDAASHAGRAAEPPEGRRAAGTPGAASPAASPAAGPRPLPARPARALAVITCMDARVDPLPALGLRPGDAHVIRNAGAMVSDDVLRSLRLSAGLGTRRAVLIGHTDCRGHASDEAAAAALRDGLRRIRGSSAVPEGYALEALMYDVRTGTVSPLD